eukprot:153501_1
MYITGFGPFFAENCPLTKLKYHCSSFKNVSFNDYSLVFQFRNINKNIQQNITHTFYDHFMNRLMIKQTIFEKPNTNVLIFGNSNYRQIYESLQCMLWQSKLLKTIKNPKGTILIVSSEKNDPNILHRYNYTIIPCASTSDDSFVKDWTRNKYSSNKDLNANFFLLNDKEMEYIKDKPPCISDRSYVHFEADNSNIYYSFSHQQRHKSLINQINIFSKQLNISNYTFMKTLDLIIMNPGNGPNFERKRFVDEINVINGHKDDNDKNVTVIATTIFWNSYKWLDLENINHTSMVWIDFGSILHNIVKDRDLFYSILNGDNHWCMPTVPQHLWLLLFEMMNAVLENR